MIARGVRERGDGVEVGKTWIREGDVEEGVPGGHSVCCWCVVSLDGMDC